MIWVIYKLCILLFYRSTSKIKENVDQIHMYWLEIITGGLPPCILIQGNTIQTVTSRAWMNLEFT